MRIIIVDLIDFPGVDALNNVKQVLDQYATSHIEWERVALNSGNPQLEKLAQADKVLISGSKWSTYEEIPWKKDLEQIYKALAEKQISTYAVCFGAQFLAQFLGGKVSKNPHGTEFGSISVSLTEAGKKNALLQGFDQERKLHATHNDHIETLPGSCELLAYNDNTAVQAFHYQNFFATQFHPDIPLHEIEGLLNGRKEKYQASGVIRDEEHFKQTKEDLKLGRAGYQILARFLSL